MTRTKKINIWNISGAILILYGLLILGSGIYYIYYPPVHVLLSNTHPSIWWGCIMIIGGILLSCCRTKVDKQP